MPLQMPWRMECQPEATPPRYGDVEEAATSTGTSARTSPSRCSQPSAGPASRLTCSAAVAVIISIPGAAQPRASKCCSMAAYRGAGLIRETGRAGSVPSGAAP